MTGLSKLIAVWGAITIMSGAFLTVSYGAHAASTHIPIFNSSETTSPRINLFPKWGGALERYFGERKLQGGTCEASFFNRCHLREWSEFLAGLKGQDAISQVHEVNRYMNRVRYITDPRNYGIPDYWATPKQFLTRNGDCEDYAIAKYLSLRSLGFQPSQLRIVVLQDLNLKIAHAILVVDLNGQALVLDNQIASVVNARTIHHYKAIYSINEKFWWLHRS
jgi:predicted transglutaminase-like cysteine proteinase